MTSAETVRRQTSGDCPAGLVLRAVDPAPQGEWGARPTARQFL